MKHREEEVMEPKEKERNIKLMNKFNELFKAGDKIKYRLSPITPYHERTITYKAFIIPSGHAVTYFNEVSGNHSIEPIFVKYPADFILDQVEQTIPPRPVTMNLAQAILIVLKDWYRKDGAIFLDYDALIILVSALLEYPVTEKDVRKTLSCLHTSGDVILRPIKDALTGQMRGSGFFYNDKKE
jgi:hypothetical protein